MTSDSYIRTRHLMQANDFRGLRWKNAMPTDIDAFAEFGNRLFVFVELKYGDFKMPYGQELALTRLCDAVQGIPCYLLVATHTTPAEEDVDVGQAVVTTVYFSGRWQTPRQTITVQGAIDKLRQKHNIP